MTIRSVWRHSTSVLTCIPSACAHTEFAAQTPQQSFDFGDDVTFNSVGSYMYICSIYVQKHTFVLLHASAADCLEKFCLGLLWPAPRRFFVTVSVLSER